MHINTNIFVLVAGKGEVGRNDIFTATKYYHKSHIPPMSDSLGPSGIVLANNN